MNEIALEVECPEASRFVQGTQRERLPIGCPDAPSDGIFDAANMN